MYVLRTVKILVFALLVVWVFGCSDDEKNIQAPPTPPKVNLQMINGLPNDDVWDIFVDSMDRVWVATNEGLAMFEGSEEMKWFTGAKGLPNRQCRSIAELNNKIFIGTWGGGFAIADSESIYDQNKKFISVKTTDGLVSDRIFDIAVDDSSIWIATVAGVDQYVDNEALEVEDRIIGHTGEFGAGVFSSIMVLENTSRGTEIWVSEKIHDEGGTLIPGGMRVKRFPGFQWFNSATSGIPSDDVNEVAYDPVNDLVWSAHATSGAASLDVDPRIWSHFTADDGLRSNLASSIAVNHTGAKWEAGTIWLATQAGVSRVSPAGVVTNYIEGSGLPFERVRKVYVDHNDDVWFAFVERGAGKVLGAQ